MRNFDKLINNCLIHINVMKIINNFNDNLINLNYYSQIKSDIVKIIKIDKINKIRKIIKIIKNKIWLIHFFNNNVNNFNF